MKLLSVRSTVCLASNKGLRPTVRLSTKLLHLANFVAPGSNLLQKTSQDLSYFHYITETVFAFFWFLVMETIIGLEPITNTYFSIALPLSYIVGNFPRCAVSVAAYSFEVHNTTHLMTFICRLLVRISGYFGHCSPFSLILPLALICRFGLL